MYRIFSSRHVKLKDNIAYQWELARKRGESDVSKIHEIMINEIKRYEMSRTKQDYGNGKQPDDKIHRLSMVE